MLVRGDLDIVARDNESCLNKDRNRLWYAYISKKHRRPVNGRTIQLAPSILTSNRPSLEILLADRQIYSEAYPIFYGQNNFTLVLPDRDTSSIELCDTFLRDRLGHAIKEIRHISLSLGSGKHWTLDGEVYPIHKAIWSHLCSTLGERMSLRSLTLMTKGCWNKYYIELFGYESSPRWIEQLYKITGLQELTIHDTDQCCGDQIHIDRVSPLVATMLQGGNEKAINATSIDKGRPDWPENWPKYFRYRTMTTMDPAKGAQK